MKITRRAAIAATLAAPALRRPSRPSASASPIACRPSSRRTQAAEFFAKNVATRTNNRVVIELSPASNSAAGAT